MHRHERFSKDYLAKIENMVQILISYIFKKYKDMDRETMELNKSIATFLKVFNLHNSNTFSYKHLLLQKCLSLMDRGFVFKQINCYMEKFNPGDQRILQEYKFTFLEIICSHEHYIIFNLPIQHTRLSPKNRSPDFLQEFCLSEDFCRHHFIVALLLQEIKMSLSEVPQIRKIAVNTLRDLLAKHEMDDRYQKNGQMNRIALIYVPWLGIVLENLSRFNVLDKPDDGYVNSSINRMSSSSSYLFSKNSVASDVGLRSHRFTMYSDRDSPMHLRHSTFFDAIAGQRK